MESWVTSFSPLSELDESQCLTQSGGTLDVRPRTQPPHPATGTPRDCAFPWGFHTNLKKPLQGCLLSHHTAHPQPLLPNTDPSGPVIKAVLFTRCYHTPGRTSCLLTSGLQCPCWGQVCFSEFLCQIHASPNGPFFARSLSCKPSIFIAGGTVYF